MNNVGKTMRILSKSARTFFHKNKTSLLTASTIVGVLSTAANSVLGTVLAIKKVKEIKEENDGKISAKDVVTKIAPLYIPAALSIGSSVASVVCLNSTHKKEYSALMNAYASVSQTAQNYKDILDGNVESENLLKEPERQLIGTDADKTCKFYDSFGDRYFESTLADVYKALYDANNIHISQGKLYLGELYKLLRLPAKRNDYDKGWDVEYIYDETDSYWIHFLLRRVSKDGEVFYVLDADEPPMCIDYYVSPREKNYTEGNKK